MPLTMRATGASSPNDQRLEDFAIYSGQWAVGRIYEQRGGPEQMRWFWSNGVRVDPKRGDRSEREGGDARRGQGAVRDRVAALAGVGEAQRA